MIKIRCRLILTAKAIKGKQSNKLKRKLLIQSFLKLCFGPKTYAMYPH